MLKIIRRTILLVLLLAAALLGVIGYSYFIEPNRLTVKTFTVTTEKEVSPCTVVFFTDTHFGEYYDIAHAEEIVDTINGLDPDFVLFGGDLLDNYARDRQALDLEALRDSLSRVEARAGKFAVWGNHDYGGGAVRIYQEFMTSCGFTVLDDESQLFEEYGIRVFGYDDVLVGWTPPELYTIQSEAFNLILSHEPCIARQIESSSDNLLLAGHTHGGQVSLPLITARLLPPGSEGFRKGFYTQGEIGTETALQMYVSSGIGMTRYPFRLFNVPEIVQIQLRPAEG